MNLNDVKKLYGGTKGKILSFIDITENYKLNITPPKLKKLPEIPTQVKHQETVNKIIPEIEKNSKQNLKKVISHLSNYTTRFAMYQSGVEAANWLKDQYQMVIDGIRDPERKKLFSVELINHNSYIHSQPSIIAKFKGSENPEIKVILGSHLDSTAMFSLTAPGADDDGTGAASVLELFRVIANSNYIPKRTIEFHAYAAEEIGLLGSADIARRYRNAGEQVFVMMQMDMNGYNPNNANEVAVVTNGVSREVTSFAIKCIEAYCQFPPRETTLYAGTSDHASWRAAGYPNVCFPFEVSSNPWIHTGWDTLDNLDLNLSVEHLKMGLGFIVECSS